MEQFRIFSSVAAAIFLEAMPFLALGALLSAVIEVLVPRDRIARFVPKRVAPGLALGMAAGFVIPTCECGVVPIVRRLMKKGVPPHVAVAYMLTAPIVNPVVLASTFVAFGGSIAMTVGRVLFAVVVATLVGVIAWRMRGPAVRDTGENGSACAHDHGAPAGGRFRRILVHAAHDFLDMGKYLVLGALAAAAFKTFLPQGVFKALTGNALLSIGGMMLLAFLLSVCSEADAFVAVSFAGIPSAAKLAFVTYGPMLDLKLVGMYAMTFRRPLFLALLLVPTVAIFGLAVLWQVWS